jgi:hypothetical protein
MMNTLNAQLAVLIHSNSLALVKRFLAFSPDDLCSFSQNFLHTARERSSTILAFPTPMLIYLCFSFSYYFNVATLVNSSFCIYLVLAENWHFSSINEFELSLLIALISAIWASRSLPTKFVVFPNMQQLLYNGADDGRKEEFDERTPSEVEAKRRGLVYRYCITSDGGRRGEEELEGHLGFSSPSY